MVKIYEESSSKFSFEISGNNEIDAYILTHTLNNIVESLQYITTQYEPEAYAKIKVTSFRNESFDIDFKAIIFYLPMLFACFKKGAEFAQTIIGTFSDFIEIKKHLKGDKPKNIIKNKGKSKIVNCDQEELLKDTEVVDMYFKNSKADTHITNIFNIIMDDDSKTGVTIKHRSNKVIIGKDDFENMVVPIINDNEEIKETITNTVKVDLLLKKPDLLGNSKWGFILDKSIEATIKDEDWLNKVHTGQIKLYAGVKIPVELVIECDLDKSNNIISTRYTIIKITGDIIEPTKDENLNFFK